MGCNKHDSRRALGGGSHCLGNLVRGGVPEPQNAMFWQLADFYETYQSLAEAIHTSGLIVFTITYSNLQIVHSLAEADGLVDKAPRHC
eukprot:scaffold319478_cov18-Tisochrysis_lutea.AAC.3